MVNTFLPFPDFLKCARILDWKRLGKQRVEAKQLINALTNVRPDQKGWRHHPATLMWYDYVPALKIYTNIMIQEWVCRGYNNTMTLYDDVPSDQYKVKQPWFLNWPMFHLSHQAALLRKDPKHYGPYFTDVPEEYMKQSYLWPSHLTQEQLDNIKVNLAHYTIDLITQPHVDGKAISLPKALREQLRKEAEARMLLVANNQETKTNDSEAVNKKNAEEKDEADETNDDDDDEEEEVDPATAVNQLVAAVEATPAAKRKLSSTSLSASSASSGSVSSALNSSVSSSSSSTSSLLIPMETTVTTSRTISSISSTTTPRAKNVATTPTTATSTPTTTTSTVTRSMSYSVRTRSMSRMSN